MLVFVCVFEFIPRGSHPQIYWEKSKTSASMVTQHNINNLLFHNYYRRGAALSRSFSGDFGWQTKRSTRISPPIKAESSLHTFWDCFTVDNKLPRGKKAPPAARKLAAHGLRTRSSNCHRPGIVDTIISAVYHWCLRLNSCWMERELATTFSLVAINSFALEVTAVSLLR